MDTYHYVYADHLGSILTVTDASGTVEFEQNFDAWGRRRNTTTWAYTGVTAPPDWLYRGYTGHEHLTEFNLINMNGRLYDPVVGRVLSPDNFVQDPFSTQGFNRYSYGFNNPLKYTDPDGNNPLIGALIGGLGYFFSVAFSDGGFKNWDWGQFGASLVVGLVTAGAADVIGGLANEVIVNSTLRAGFQVAAHGLVGGFASTVQGGSFGTGALTSAAGSLLGTATGALGFKGAAMIGSSAVFGGTVSAVFGGNFWQGAAQAGIVAGFNHFMHSFQADPIERLRRRILADGNLTLEESYEWWRRAGGRSITIDASKLDLGWIHDDEWNADRRKAVQTLYMSDKGRVHGNMWLQRIDANRASIDEARYDFDMLEWWGNTTRNVITSFAEWRANDYGRQIGVPFQIIYRGAALINQPRTNVPPHIYMFN